MDDSFKSAFGNQSDGIGSESRLKRLESGEVKLRRGSAVPTNAPFRRTGEDFTDQLGRFDLRKTNAIKKGSTPSIVMAGNFGYTAASSTVTLYWDGTNGSTVFVIYRPDGTQQVVPPSNITVSALNASTTYYFLPYFNTLGCQGGNVAFAQGDSGSPQVLFSAKNSTAAAQQSSQYAEAMSTGFLTCVTAAGGGTGSGTGGGSNRTYADGCPRVGQLVEVKGKGIVPVERVRVNDYLASPDGNGWMRVISCPITPCERFVAIGIEDDSMVVSETTDIPLALGMSVKAPELRLGDELVVRHNLAPEVIGLSTIVSGDDDYKVDIALEPINGEHPRYWVGTK